MPMLAQIGGITHSMMVDGIMSVPGGIEGTDEYGEEAEALESIEYTKYKKDQIVISADHTKRKTKIVCTIG